MLVAGLTAACSTRACDIAVAVDQSAQPKGGPLRVSAAVSLTDALTPIARKWEGAGNIHVELNFAASNVLARQILEGAPVDVFISADEAQMNRIVEAGAAGKADVIPLLTNQLVVVTPAGEGRAATRARRRRREADCDWRPPGRTGRRVHEGVARAGGPLAPGRAEGRALQQRACRACGG
jgi:ABC-type molybdate transport system substrate-binding protein